MTGTGKLLLAFLAGAGLTALALLAYRHAMVERGDRPVASPAREGDAPDRGALHAPPGGRLQGAPTPGGSPSPPTPKPEAHSGTGTGNPEARSLKPEAPSGTGDPGAWAVDSGAVPLSARGPRRYLIDDTALRPAGPDTEGRQVPPEAAGGRCYESWFLDGVSDDGHVFTALFLIHDVGRPAAPGAAPAGATALLDVALYRPDGSVHRLKRVFSPSEIEASAAGLALRFGPARWERLGNDFRLTLDDEALAADLTLTPLLPPAWRLHRSFTVGNEPTVREFCSVRTVPLGAWNGAFRVAGEVVPLTGTGYHDHIWTKHLALTSDDLDTRRVLWLRVVTDGTVTFVMDREHLNGARETEAALFDRNGAARTVLFRVDVLGAEGARAAPRLADGMPAALFVGLREHGTLRLWGGATLDEIPGYRRRRFQATLEFTRAGSTTTERGTGLAELVTFGGG